MVRRVFQKVAKSGRSRNAMDNTLQNITRVPSKMRKYLNRSHTKKPKMYMKGFKALKSFNPMIALVQYMVAIILK